MIYILDRGISLSLSLAFVQHFRNTGFNIDKNFISVFRGAHGTLNRLQIGLKFFPNLFFHFEKGTLYFDSHFIHFL